MKSGMLLFFALAAPTAAPTAYALQATLPAPPPVVTEKVVAQDTNGPYTLQVVRAAWVKGSEVQLADEDLTLTLWVRVIGNDQAQKPMAPLTLSDFVIDGRLGKVDDLFQLRVVGELKVPHRSMPPGGRGVAPAGLSVWRAQSARRDWPVVRAEFEFLSLEAGSLQRLPQTILDSTERESGPLRRFTVDIPSQSIEIPAAPKPKPDDVFLVNKYGLQFAVSKAQINPQGSFESADYPPKRVWEKGKGIDVQVPVLVAGPDEVRRFKSGLRYGGLLQSPKGEIVEMSIRRGGELRPDGTPLGEKEESFVLNAYLPEQTDLSGPWGMTLFRLPEADVVEQKVLDNLTVATTPAGGATTGAGLLQIPAMDLNEWAVLDVRRFDADHPLPASFGHTWRIGGTALLLMTRVKDLTSIPSVSVESVKDAADAQVKDRHDEARLIGRGSSKGTTTGGGASYLTYRVILSPRTELQEPFSLELKVAHSNTEPIQIGVPARLQLPGKAKE
jgi:hypothetical protein